MKTTRTINAFRKEFPQFQGRIYFNHGASSLLPTSVVNASMEGVRLGADYSVSSEMRRKWLEIKNETRRMAAELIGAKAENVAFVSSTSTALSLISLAIPWKRGDNAVTAAIGNPATIVPWQNLQHAGVEVRYMPADSDDLLDLDTLPDLVDDRTRLIALSLVEYSTGQKVDIRRVADWCRLRGILISVDAVQAVGAVPVDVMSLGANFLCSGAQKWLMGPRNIAVLYADDTSLRTVRSPIVTEGNVRDVGAEEEEPTRGIPELKINEGALKLEAVPYNNFAGVFGFHQALKNLRSVGQATAYQRLHDITNELVEGLGRLDGRVVSPRGRNEWSGIVSYAPNEMGAKEIVRRLYDNGVHISVRKGRLRICPHYYNTSDEVSEFLSILKRVSRSRR